MCCVRFDSTRFVFELFAALQEFNVVDEGVSPQLESAHRAVEGLGLHPSQASVDKHAASLASLLSLLSGKLVCSFIPIYITTYCAYTHHPFVFRLIFVCFLSQHVRGGVPGGAGVLDSRIIPQVLFICCF
jgi:hypothetical protein